MNAAGWRLGHEDGLTHIPICVQELKANPERLPFDKIVFCNIGNPQQLGQRPLTYLRQVCCTMAIGQA